MDFLTTKRYEQIRTILYKRSYYTSMMDSATYPHQIIHYIFPFPNV